MKVIKLSLISLIFFSSYFVLAQQNQDWGSIFSLEANKKFNSQFSLGFEAEHRSRADFTENERWNLDASLDYTICKYLKIGGGLSYIYFNHLKKGWENRYRWTSSLTGKYSIGDFDFTLRERFQSTERQGISEYNKKNKRVRANPKFVLRSRLKIKYDIPNVAFEPFFSLELFHKLNHPTENGFSKIRYILGTEYKLTKSHSLSAFFRYVDSEDIDEDDCLRILALGYKFKF